jgi:hypothetical protein
VLTEKSKSIICAVCDSFVEKIVTYFVKDLVGRRVHHMMKKHLTFPSDLPPKLAAQYNQKHLHPCLEGIMLEINGIQVNNFPMTITIFFGMQYKLSKRLIAKKMLWRTGCFMCLLHPSFNR